jgi:hypothetical protein
MESLRKSSLLLPSMSIDAIICLSMQEEIADKMNYSNSSATLGVVLLKNIVVGKAHMGNWAAAVNTYQSITKLCVPSINTKICSNISLKIQKCVTKRDVTMVI